MKARTDTKEKIIELGKDLFQSVGYPSLSYQQISSKLGIKNAAVHYHYPSKEDLGLDIINQETANFERFTSSIFDLNPWEKLEAFLTSYRKNLENGNKLCIIGSSASDYSELPESLQSASAEYFIEFKKWFTELLETGRASGAFYFKGEPQNKAAFMSSALAGALQHARLIGSQHYDAVVSQLKLELKE